MNFKSKHKKLDFALYLMMLSIFCVASMYVSYNTLHPPLLPLLIIFVSGYLSCIICMCFRQKSRVFNMLIFLPYVLVFVLSKFQFSLLGIFSWLDAILIQYNQYHNCGIQLFNMAVSALQVQSFAMVFSLLQIDILFWLLHKKYKKIFLFLFIFLWIILLLNIGQLNPLLFALFLMISLSLLIYEMTELTRFWIVIFSVVILTISSFCTNSTNESMHDFKIQTSQIVHNVRYGKENLPLGNLMQANLLAQGNDERMQVTSTYLKDLYLKSYVGSVYKDNQWQALSQADYGYENTGMLDWLNKNDFDPFTQVSTYYSLGKKSMKTNRVHVLVKDATRDYLYSVSSLKKIPYGLSKTQQDYGLETKGLFGKKEYDWQEVSTDKPYELTTSDAWLQSPSTKKQKMYLKSESVYRQFVYDHYLKIDRNLNSLMKDYFWKDYKTDENDSIYSAILQIRKCLEKDTKYQSQLDSIQNNEAMHYFLTKSKKGNSAFYATCATLALRSHGIPARYVEGYYVSKEDFDNSDIATVKGTNSHAWTEIYYDGIGWLPVDFTPGYYDEAVVLQNMVGKPDAVHKTASTKKNKKNKADEMYSKNNKGRGILKERLHLIVNILGMAMGICVLVILIGTILFLVIEFVRVLKIRGLYRKFKNSTLIQRMILLQKVLVLFFKIHGLSISFSWDTSQTDQMISQKMDSIEPGDFERISYLMEKSIYGGIELEEYEMRTIKKFIEKVYAHAFKQNIWVRLKMHYALLRLKD